MAGITYKCPNCGGYLSFEPDSQKWSCPFCASQFTQKELLDNINANEKSDNATTTPHTSDSKKENTTANSQVIYHCQSCGSQIMTDETTVATHCYYCHSPVVLEGKLDADGLPNGVLPFSLSKETAINAFLKWIENKKFVPKGFFKKSEIDSMVGVYYPHYITDVIAEGNITGEGQIITTMDRGKYTETHTQHYHVLREADMRFHNVMRPALDSMNRKLNDGTHPYPLEKIEPFSSTYLSGFVAERKNVDMEKALTDIEDELEEYVEPLLSRDTHYTTHQFEPFLQIKDKKTSYMLLPTWVLTYRNKANPQDPYYFSMNGSTGKTCGKLPIDYTKLWLTAGGIGAGILLIACIICYFFI